MMKRIKRIGFPDELLDLAVFSKAFLLSLNYLKSKAGIILNTCSTFDDSALHFPIMQNITSLGVQLSIHDPRFVVINMIPTQVIPKRRNHQVVSAPSLTGSQCLVQVLKRNPRLQSLDLHLGVKRNRGHHIEAEQLSPILSALQLLGDLRSLEISGQFTHPRLPFTTFEQLESLSIVGNELIKFVVENSCGGFPRLQRFQVNSREISWQSENMNCYYDGTPDHFSKFLAATSLERLSMRGFKPGFVRSILDDLRTPLESFQCHDLDIFSDSLPSPIGTLPQYEYHGETWNGGRSTLDNDRIYQQHGPPRWPFLNFLNEHRPQLDFSTIHCAALSNLLDQSIYDSLVPKLSVFGIDVERQHLISSIAKQQLNTQDDDDSDEYSRQESWKKAQIEKDMKDFKILPGKMAANFEMLDKLSLLKGVKYIDLHLIKTTPKAYWRFTIKEAVQTFCHLQNSKSGEKLLKLSVSDTYCSRRYIIQCMGSNRVVVQTSHRVERPFAQIWQARPPRYLHQVELNSGILKDCWALVS
jgi:hypothetical protein